MLCPPHCKTHDFSFGDRVWMLTAWVDCPPNCGVEVALGRLRRVGLAIAVSPPVVVLGISGRPDWLMTWGGIGAIALWTVLSVAVGGLRYRPLKHLEQKP